MILSLCPECLISFKKIEIAGANIFNFHNQYYKCLFHYFSVFLNISRLITKNKKKEKGGKERPR